MDVNNSLCPELGRCSLAEHFGTRASSETIVLFRDAVAAAAHFHWLSVVGSGFLGFSALAAASTRSSEHQPRGNGDAIACV
jgi:hypothetical protein